MPQLRLTLLVVGLIFLVGLAWWELRRPHQARGNTLPRPAPDPLERPPERTADWDLPGTTALSRARKGELELPRMTAREPEQELPVVEVGPEEFAAFEAGAQPAHPEAGEHTEEMNVEEFVPDFAAPEERFVDTRFGEDFANEVTVEPLIEAPAPIAKPAGPPPVEETVARDPDVAVVGPATTGVDGLLDELGTGFQADPPISDIDIEPAPVGPAAEPERTIALTPATEVEPAADAAPAAPSLPETPPAGVVVEWPAAETSKVIALRIISVGEKFSGRAVRLALAAEGFELGKFEIFHKPAADGRALLSIASLNKPGTFQAQSIDMQRYSGLNLFAVLPGPLPGPAAAEELLACAQILAQRLRGVLQDDQGAPLNAARTAALRNQAAAAPT